MNVEIGRFVAELKNDISVVEKAAAGTEQMANTARLETKTAVRAVTVLEGIVETVKVDIAKFEEKMSEIYEPHTKRGPHDRRNGRNVAQVPIATRGQNDQADIADSKRQGSGSREEFDNGKWKWEAWSSRCHREYAAKCTGYEAEGRSCDGPRQAQRFGQGGHV